MQVEHGAELVFCSGQLQIITGTLCDVVAFSFDEGNFVSLGPWRLGYEPKTVPVGSDTYWNFENLTWPEGSPLGSQQPGERPRF